MTPEERAEKIVIAARKMNVELSGPVLFPIVAAEIRAAVEEEAMLRMDWNFVIEELEKRLAIATKALSAIKADELCCGGCSDCCTDEAKAIASQALAEIKNNG